MSASLRPGPPYNFAHTLTFFLRIGFEASVPSVHTLDDNLRSEFLRPVRQLSHKRTKSSLASDACVSFHCEKEWSDPRGKASTHRSYPPLLPEVSRHTRQTSSGKAFGQTARTPRRKPG